MAKMSDYALIASILMTSLAIVLYLAYAVSGLRAARMQTAGLPASSGRPGLHLRAAYLRDRSLRDHASPGSPSWRCSPA